MLEERGAQSDAEPVLRRTKAVTAVPDTTVPETAVPETATRECAPAASPGKPLPAPRSERVITGVYRDPVTRARRHRQGGLASPHPDRNKAFRQAVVALGHSMA